MQILKFCTTRIGRIVSLFSSDSEETSKSSSVDDVEPPQEEAEPKAHDDVNDMASTSVRVKDCLPGLFELFNGKAFMPLQFGGVDHPFKRP